MIDKQHPEEQETPKMSDELAAQSEIAALEYSVPFKQENYDGSDICEAHEAGQGWMWRKLTETKAAPVHQWKADFIRRLKEKSNNAFREGGRYWVGVAEGVEWVIKTFEEIIVPEADNLKK